MIAHNRPTLGREESEAASRVIASGWVAQGPEVEAFENELCAFLGLPEGHAVAVSSGTAALFLALWCGNAEGKRSVAYPAYACSALSNAVAMVRARAIVLDLGSHKNILACAFHKAVESDEWNVADEIPRVVIVPQTFGIPQEAVYVKDQFVIADCAQSLGSTFINSNASVFSFSATKLITTGGQGGAFASANKSFVDAVRDYRQFDGRRDRNPRFNFQMTDIQAAIGRAKLKKLPSFLERRETIFQRYKSAGFPLMDGQRAVRYRAVLRTSKPRETIAALAEDGIKAIVPIEDWELLGNPDDFPNAKHLTQTTVSLPIYPSLTDKEVSKILICLERLPRQWLL